MHAVRFRLKAVIGLLIRGMCGRRELKRMREEESSCFNKYQLLADSAGTPRYLLGNLLGKGGFSEVYRVRTSPDVPYTLNPREPQQA